MYLNSLTVKEKGNLNSSYENILVVVISTRKTELNSRERPVLDLAISDFFKFKLPATQFGVIK